MTPAHEALSKVGYSDNDIGDIRFALIVAYVHMTGEELRKTMAALYERIAGIPMSKRLKLHPFSEVGKDGAP